MQSNIKNNPQSNFTSHITRYGVSDTFIALIAGIRETLGLTEQKFRRADVDKVAQYLVCRNYGKACLELSYLCWAVINHPAVANEPSPLLDFFWLQENINPARFRKAFAKNFQPNANTVSILLNKEVLQLQLSATVFAISPTRVGALAVLLECLVNMAPQGFALLTEIENSLASNVNQAENTEKTIKKLSSQWQKIIYHYLSQHLIPAQQQRRLRYITQWLDTTNDKKDNKKADKKDNKNDHQAALTQKTNPQKQIPLQVTLSSFLTDETLLHFWQYASVDELSPGFKLYSSVFYEFIELDKALKQAQAALQHQQASSIGFAVEYGEYSPEYINDILFTQCTTEHNYQWLCDSPKYLTQAQWALIAPLQLEHAYIKTLPLSFARLFVFGQWQGVLVQAKRKSSIVVQQKLAELPEQGYRSFYQQLDAAKNNISGVLLAIVHIFYAHKDPRFLGLLVEQSSLKLSQEFHLLLKKQGQNILQSVNLAPTSINSQAIFNDIHTKLRHNITLQHAFQQIIQHSQQAFKVNNKDGFKYLPQAHLLDNYQQGAEALQQCLSAVNELTQHKKAINLIKSEIFHSDVSIFNRVFKQIYGGCNGQ